MLRGDGGVARVGGLLRDGAVGEGGGDGTHRGGAHGARGRQSKGRASGACFGCCRRSIVVVVGVQAQNRTTVHDIQVKCRPRQVCLAVTLSQTLPNPCSVLELCWSVLFNATHSAARLA